MMNQVQAFSNSPAKASCIIGTDVVNPKGDDLGDIKEIVIDPRTGKVAYAVISFGGLASYRTLMKCYIARPDPVFVCSTLF